MARSIPCTLILALALGCGGTASGTDAASAADTGPATCAAPGMVSAGPADTHCAPDIVQPVLEASCFGPESDTGAGDVDAGVETCEYGDTQFAMEGDDDDCKYHFAWTSTPICEGTAGVRFTIVATNKSDGSPLTGGNLEVETFRSEGAACDLVTTHPGPNTFVHFTEGPPGTYTGPVQFDEPGQWTIRFHVRQECSDANEDSPHGHAAFRLTVP